jgi:excisionase family DNA binding protein
MQVTIAEAAKLLRVSEHTVRRRVRNGELPSVQVARSQGYVWMIELPDDSPPDIPASGEIAALHQLIDSLNVQVDSLKEQLVAKDKQLETRAREVQELHVLLQQAQAALPAPKESQHSWWYKLWHRNGR